MDWVNELSDDALLKMGAEFDLQMKQAKAKADEVKAEIRRRHPGAEVLGEDGEIQAKVTYPRRFDERLARQVLTPEEQEQITVPVLDGALAKKKFGEEQYELLSRPDTPRVSFKIPK